MNSLRLTARIIACLVGVGGVALTLINLPWSALTVSSRPPAYVFSNLIFGALFPLLLCLTVTIGLLLIARVDERLERLEQRRDA
ncbi:hypothetical protein [Brevundimonas sp.]|uniref:hypothetical protein n=1 Tax=Brevundimonas sp. TaxID=1871086 RepID=UPI002D29C5E5|nr:hypothetical protein [Brevundimonas sp.]HYD27354.1 hypothetical protein [Brevundimonas sp.]